jgi:CheY-like chemotaxis protein
MTPLNVLVMEDDAVLGLLLGEVLEEMGHVCAIEATEAGAIASARRSRPQLMIVDVRLGEGSGICAVEEILRDGEVPHIFVSGDLSIVRTLLPERVAIQKPFRASDLVRAMDRALGAAA